MLAILSSHQHSVNHAEDLLSKTTLSHEQKVLGLNWHMAMDTFIFNLDSITKLAQELCPTKRNVISLIGKFYDPLRFLSTIVIQYKIFMQKLLEASIEWDEELAGKLLLTWWNDLVKSL